jgi:hypothetical protein
MATREELQARITAAAKAKADLEAGYDVEDLERKVVLDELEVKLAKEIGRRGEAFELVDGGPEGPIALKLGEAVLYKKYKAAVAREKDTDEDLMAFVAPCVVVPEAARFHEIVFARKHLLTKCGDALLKLYGAWEDKSRGK